MGDLSKIINSFKIPTIAEYHDILKEKYKGCYCNSFSEILEMEQLPYDIQSDIMNLSKKHIITLCQAKKCYMALGNTEQTDKFCMILRDNGDLIFNIELNKYLEIQHKKNMMKLKLLAK